MQLEGAEMMMILDNYDENYLSIIQHEGAEAEGTLPLTWPLLTLPMIMMMMMLKMMMKIMIMMMMMMILIKT